MTWDGIEPRSPGPLANILPTKPMRPELKKTKKIKFELYYRMQTSLFKVIPTFYTLSAEPKIHCKNLPPRILMACQTI